MIKLPKNSLLFSLITLLVWTSKIGNAQSNKEKNEIVKFGIGLKMVVTSDLLSGAATNFQEQGVTFSYEPNLSRGIDAIIRFRLKNRFSLESGITTIRRSYSFGMSTDTLAFEGSLVQTSFQMPFTGLLQVQISENSRIGVKAGFIAEMYPGDVATGDKNHYALIYVQSRLNSSLNTGASYNYKLKNNGAIELSFTYVRMMGRLGSFYMDYESIDKTIGARSDLQGHFFTLGLAYFFP